MVCAGGLQVLGGLHVPIRIYELSGDAPSSVRPYEGGGGLICLEAPPPAPPRCVVALVGTLM